MFTYYQLNGIDLFICCLFIFSKSAIVQDASVKKLINEQTAQWSAMVEKQKKDEWQLQKAFAETSKEEMKKIIGVVQVEQNKMLQVKHDKYVANFNLD